MTDGFTVDPGLLVDVAERLRRAGLIELGSGPPAPDAGEVSGEVGAVLAHLLHGVAELAAGATAAGDGVAASAAMDRADDERAARALTEGG